jgi:gliding motility-associated-like protein
MTGQFNNGLNNMDEILRNALSNHNAELNPDLWGNLKLKLFKQDMAEFANFKKLKNSFNPKASNLTMQVKVWSSYFAAACLAVGVVFGSSQIISNYLNKPSEKSNNKMVPVVNKANHDDLKKANIDSIKSAQISGLPANAKPDNKVIKRQNFTTVQKTSTIPNKNNVTNNPNINSIPKESIKPVVSSNLNSLINYIQRLNPQDHIVNKENTEPVQNGANISFDDNIPITNDSAAATVPNPVYQIEIPNVITPNGDGYNDVLVIKNLDKFPDNNLLIADRTGKIVFDKSSYENDWDGRNLQDGTYYYILTYKDKNKNRGIIKGLITIVRK